MSESSTPINKVVFAFRKTTDTGNSRHSKAVGGDSTKDAVRIVILNNCDNELHALPEDSGRLATLNGETLNQMCNHSSGGKVPRTSRSDSQVPPLMLDAESLRRLDSLKDSEYIDLCFCLDRTLLNWHF